MMILTQDKKRLVNPAHLVAIRAKTLQAPEEGPTSAQIIGDVAGDYEWEYDLGTYPTEERALEVIQEMIDKFTLYYRVEGGPVYTRPGGYVQPLMFEPPKVYEMPPAQPAESEAT